MMQLFTTQYAHDMTKLVKHDVTMDIRYNPDTTNWTLRAAIDIDGERFEAFEWTDIHDLPKITNKEYKQLINSHAARFEL